MFLPIGDDNSRRRSFPFFTWAIVAANAYVWYKQLLLGQNFTYGYAAVPLELTHGVDLIDPQTLHVGGATAEIPQAPGPTPIYLTLMSSMFMHGSWGHIFGNMLYLIIFGDQIEDLLGRVRFVFFYIACGVAAGLTQVLANPNSPVPLLGASGAIAGVLGAYLIKYPRNPVQVLFWFRVIHLPAFIVLGGWIVLQVLSQTSVSRAYQSGVAYLAHIGGFAAGVVLILWMGTKRRRR